MTALDLQRRLAALGFDPGPLDGVQGRRTAAALKAFQAKAGLVPDGIAGPLTRAALGLAAAPQDLDPPWLAEARRWMGLGEIAGPGSNPKILEWGRAASELYRDDDTPWCGAFVFAQFAAALADEPLPVNPLWARGWARFGVALAKPAPGAVLVFERGPTGGHMGFYVGEDASRFRVIGGNQSNAVTETWIAKRRLIAIRWPATVAAASPRRVRISAAGATSANEA